ncbi:uncharacterized protein LOC5512987 [Nematostella vectensis]|uniref:uncharacterized protein LOC5512987 n=1 Tax=Nematostella vectensis TaxID=45351 RepID=UPI00138F9ED5|nr:uncharacterized protein LOC5512987 [Nematostella vectensis]
MFVCNNQLERSKLTTRMAGDREARRLRVLKIRGTKAFVEGNVSKATKMYTDALQLQTDLDINNNSRISQTDVSLDKYYGKREGNLHSTPSEDTGIGSVIQAVIHDADQGIRVNPSLPKSYLAKASALILQNNWEEARKVYIQGINHCDDCLAIRHALEKLDKMQSLLQTIPGLLERTKSTSSDTSESTMEAKSPSSQKRKFRLQHRKKLSNTMLQFTVTKSGRIKSVDDGEDDDDDDEDDDVDDDDGCYDTWF